MDSGLRTIDKLWKPASIERLENMFLVLVSFLKFVENNKALDFKGPKKFLITSCCKNSFGFALSSIFFRFILDL